MPRAVPKSQTFYYTVSTTAMANGTTENQPIVVSEDADFIVTAFLADATYWSGVTVLMRAEGYREFMNAAIPLRCFAGALQKDVAGASSTALGGPGVLDVPQRIPRQTAVTFTLYNGSGSDDNTIQMIMRGVKLFSDRKLFARLKGGQVMQV